MSRVLGQIKGLFSKRSNNRQLPPGSFPNAPGNAATLGTIHKPQEEIDEEDDDDDEIGSMRNYNVPEQTQLRAQSRQSTPTDNFNRNRSPFRDPSTSAQTPITASKNQFRNASGATTNNNMNSAPSVPSRPGLPFLSQIQDPSSQTPSNPNPPPTNNPPPPFNSFQTGMNPNQSTQPPPNNSPPSFSGFPPGMNPNQSSQPPPQNNSQPSFSGFPPGMNPNQSSQPPPQNNSQPSFSGFPPGMNPNQSSQPPQNNPPPSFSGPPSTMNNNQTSPPVPSNDAHHFPDRSNEYRSRLELDYPIENVLIDANIPQAMAVKINDTVEQDRLGNAFHIHRYTFQSSNPQQISYRDNDHHQQRNHHFGGSRYIREVDFHNPSSLYEDIKYPKHSDHHSHRRHDHDYADSSLNRYIDQLLHKPNSHVIQARDSSDLQYILQQHLGNNSIPTFPSTISSFPPTASNPFSGPVFYYTAQALYNDPMRY